MATPVIADNAAIPKAAASAMDDTPDAAAPECILPHPLRVNITPILKSVAGRLTEAEIDQWMVDLHHANEDRGFNLELTHKGDLVIRAC